MRSKQNWLSVITFVSLRSKQKLQAYTVLNVTNRPNINTDIQARLRSWKACSFLEKTDCVQPHFLCAAERKLHASTTTLHKMQPTLLEEA